MKINYGSETLCVHGGYTPDAEMHSITPPLYMTNAYDFGTVERGRQLFALETPGNIYSRLTNPTNDYFEQRMNLLEGGIGAVAFASGHAAIFGIMATLCRSGDEIVSSASIYGGAIAMLGVSLQSFGITTKFVDIDDPQAFMDNTNEKTRAWFFEMVGNPTAAVADIEKISALAKKAGVPLIVDCTFTPPTLFKAMPHGADIVVHSSTKYIGGHAAAMGGVVIDAGTFDYLDNPRFPVFNTPDPAYHDMIFAKELGKAAFITRLRTNTLRDLGACASPFNSYMMMIGLETLHLRMERHCANALAVAKMLEEHKNVTSVSFPLLPSSRYYPLAQKYLSKGCGAIFSFEIAGGRTAGAKFADSLQLLSNVANVGDSRSLVVHPASTTHSQLSPAQLAKGGITESTIRLTVGIESEADILEDIKTALDAI